MSILLLASVSMACSLLHLNDPLSKSRIFDQGEISGRFTKQAAEDLALILRSGALPAPVKIVDQGTNK